jgi:hypothetical protein
LADATSQTIIKTPGALGKPNTSVMVGDVHHIIQFDKDGHGALYVDGKPVDKKPTANTSGAQPGSKVPSPVRPG